MSTRARKVASENWGDAALNAASSKLQPREWVSTGVRKAVAALGISLVACAHQVNFELAACREGQGWRIEAVPSSCLR